MKRSFFTENATEIFLGIAVCLPALTGLVYKLFHH